MLVMKCCAAAGCFVHARHMQVMTGAQQQGMPGRPCTSADNSLQACAAGGVEATYMVMFSAGVADLVTMQLWARYCQAPVLCIPGAGFDGSASRWQVVCKRTLTGASVLLCLLPHVYGDFDVAACKRAPQQQARVRKGPGHGHRRRCTECMQTSRMPMLLASRMGTAVVVEPAMALCAQLLLVCKLHSFELFGLA